MTAADPPPDTGSPATGRSPAAARALPWPHLRAAAGSPNDRLSAGREFVSACVRREVEGRRPFLWLPVAVILGILLYFSADSEPSLALSSGLAAGAGGLSLVLRSRPVAMGLAAGAAAVFAGMTAGGWRTAGVAAPVLVRASYGTLSGTIETAEARVGTARLVLRVHRFADLPPEATPYRVRITLPSLGGLHAGDFVSTQARLIPPPPASRPGGYDFAREAWFQRLGAVGSASGPVLLAPAPALLPLELRFTAAVDRARNALTERIVAVIGGPAGAVAASLVTGKRGLIPEPVNDVLRAAGIYHVVSISGLHMVLAAGMVFWFVRALGAAIPAVALTWPLRKIAAAAAIVAGAGYNVFAGAEIATQRALVMTAALFGAMLVDRTPFSMRSLAIAALVVMALEPESVLGPSFQMSFAAVAALIALYEKTQAGDPLAEGAPVPGRPVNSGPRDGPPMSLPARGLRWLRRILVGTVGATLVAEAATAPFGLYHFQRYSAFGLFGNALTLPLVSFVVMPMAVLGAITYPLGLDAPFWIAMGWGVDAMLSLSAWVASWPGATGVVPAFGPGTLLLLCCGGLLVVLWTSPLRWLGLLPFTAGIVLAATPQRPLVLVAPDGRSAMVRTKEGSLALVGKSPGAFVIEQWLRADGDARTAADPGLGSRARCDVLGCVGRLRDGRALSVVLGAGAFVEDCRNAAVVVTALTAPSWCAGPTVLDRQRLAHTGAVVLLEEPGGTWRFVTARSPLASRGWHPPPPALRPAAVPPREAAAPGPDDPGDPEDEDP
ncbi:ComEC/Rec2 family competence protein [Alsobacter sp. R-9]